MQSGPDRGLPKPALGSFQNENFGTSQDNAQIRFILPTLGPVQTTNYIAPAVPLPFPSGKKNTSLHYTRPYQ